MHATLRAAMTAACIAGMTGGCGSPSVSRVAMRPGTLVRAQNGPADSRSTFGGAEFDRELAPTPATRGPAPRMRPSQPQVPLLLEDAIDLALQNSEVVRTLSGRSVATRPETLYDPEILEQRWRAAKAYFDPRIEAGYLGSKIDQPPDSFFGPGIPLNVLRDEGNFFATLSKPWETGGTTSVGFAPPLAYIFYPDQSIDGFNPVYAADLVFDLKQPLLRGAGIAVNTAPIRIARLRADQSSWDVKDALMGEIRSVEEAYWTLQAASATLQSYEAVMPLLHEAVRIEELRLQAELVTRAEVARTRLQRSQFQQQRVRAEADVRERELRLRQLIGLPASDGRTLVPVNPPVRREYPIVAEAALAVAVEHRPDLIRQRLGVQIREMEAMVARNGKLPQVDFRLLHRASGLGDELDHALDQMRSFRYTDWTFGLTVSMPLGNRAPTAVARAAELQLSRERALLRQNVQNVEFEIADIVRELQAAWLQYEEAKSRVTESQEWMRVARFRYQNPPPAGSTQDWLIVALNEYQQALRSHVDAVADASRLLAEYNTLLARLEEAQGTLLENRRVRMEDDPVRSVQESAVPLDWPADVTPLPEKNLGPELGGGWSQGGANRGGPRPVEAWATGPDLQPAANVVPSPRGEPGETRHPGESNQYGLVDAVLGEDPFGYTTPVRAVVSPRSNRSDVWPP